MKIWKLKMKIETQISKFGRIKNRNEELISKGNKNLENFDKIVAKVDQTVSHIFVIFQKLILRVIVGSLRVGSTLFYNSSMYK